MRKKYRINQSTFPKLTKWFWVYSRFLNPWVPNLKPFLKLIQMKQKVIKGFRKQCVCVWEGHIHLTISSEYYYLFGFKFIESTS